MHIILIFSLTYDKWVRACSVTRYQRVSVQDQNWTKAASIIDTAVADATRCIHEPYKRIGTREAGGAHRPPIDGWII